MAEAINGGTPLSSGGHAWIWDARSRAEKVLSVPGVDGAASFMVHKGARTGVIVGLLKAALTTLALADTALTGLEAVLETLVDGGAEVAWTDDMGRTGSKLVVTGYRRMAPRTYGTRTGAGDVCSAWQRYELHVRDNEGDW